MADVIKGMVEAQETKVETTAATKAEPVPPPAIVDEDGVKMSGIDYNAPASPPTPDSKPEAAPEGEKENAQCYSGVAVATQILMSVGGLEFTKAASVAGSLGVETKEDLLMCTEADLVGAGMKSIPARKLIAQLKPQEAPTPKVATPVASPMAFSSDISILPTAPSEESWLSSMRTGGILKVGTESYMSAIRVLFAEQAGLYDLPEKIADALEKYAEESDESVSPEFFRLRKMITQRNYSEIFSAIEGLDGRFVTDKRRQEFLRRVRSELLPTVREAYAALNGWYEAVRAVNSDPSALFTVLAGITNGTGAVGMTLPAFDAITDASTTLKDAINHVFRGLGTVVASAMAYDARQTSMILDNPALPAMLGAANRDQMLKKLGASVSPNYVRQEANMLRFLLSYTKFSDQIAVGDEARYLTALWQLGNQIDWKVFGGEQRSQLNSLGGTTRI